MRNQGRIKNRNNSGQILRPIKNSSASRCECPSLWYKSQPSASKWRFATQLEQFEFLILIKKQQPGASLSEIDCEYLQSFHNLNLVEFHLQRPSL